MSKIRSLPFKISLNCSSYVAHETPIDFDEMGFTAMEEENGKPPRKFKKEADTLIKVEPGPVEVSVTTELEPVTEKTFDQYFECYSSFLHGKLIFEFADKEGKVWQAQLPLFGQFFYTYVYAGEHKLTFWSDAPKDIAGKFDSGLFLELKPWGNGHFEDEYWSDEVQISGKPVLLSTCLGYATTQLSWIPEIESIVVKLSHWPLDEDADQSHLKKDESSGELTTYEFACTAHEQPSAMPFYFVLPIAEFCPLQTNLEGMTFEPTEKRGTPQPNISVMPALQAGV